VALHGILSVEEAVIIIKFYTSQLLIMYRLLRQTKIEFSR